VLRRGISRYAEFESTDMGAIASSYTRQREELVRAQTEAQQLRNAQLRGELVSVIDVEREWTATCTTVRATMLAVPTRVVQRLPHLTRADKAVIEEEIRAGLEALADDRTP
jgi:phage terminase Nu1 subunit (DNA packaging protein)